MKLNASGQAAGGRSTVHVDGALVPAFAGRVAGSASGNWFQSQVLCQVEHEGSWRLASAYPQAETYTVQAQHGQNRLMSNERIWVADLDGYIDSLGSRQPHIAPVALDDSTDQVAVAVKDTNALAIVDARTGVITEIEETGPDSWQAEDLHFTNGLLIYRKHGRIKSWPHEIDAPHIPARSVRYCDGFLLEWQEGRGVILRPEDSTHGIVVIPSGEDAYGLDLMRLPSGLIRVVSATGPAELPHEFRKRDVDPNAWTVNGEQADLIDLSKLPLPPFPKNTNRFAIAIDPGNAPSAPYMAQYVLHTVSGDLTQRQSDIDQVRRRAQPLLVYQDTNQPNLNGFDIGVPASVAHLAVPSFQCYPTRGESFETHRERTLRVCASMAQKFPVFVVYVSACRAPGQAGERTQEQLQWGIRAVAEAASIYPQLRMAVVFAWDRSHPDPRFGPDGLLHLPALYADVEAWRRSLVKSDDFLTAAELTPAAPEPVKPPVSQPVTPTPPTAPLPPKPPAVMPTPPKPEELRAMGATVLLKANLKPSPAGAAFGNRYNYKNPDGTNLSVNCRGEESATDDDGPNEWFIWKEGQAFADVWPHKDPFDLKKRFIVEG